MSRVFKRYGSAPGRFLRRHSTPVWKVPPKRQGGSAEGATEVTPLITRDEYAARRAAVLSAMPSHSMAVFPSAMQQYMSEDAPHLYHQNTDLLYLTGCAEPGATLLLDTTPSAGPAGRAVLFVEPRNAQRELWDGPMYGVEEETRVLFGVDDVQPTRALPSLVAQKLDAAPVEDSNVRTRLFLDPTTNKGTTEIFSKEFQGEKREKFLSTWSRDTVPKDFACRARLIKSPAEIELLRQACFAISGGLNDAMANCVLEGNNKSAGGVRQGTILERAIEANIEFGSKMRGASRMSFPSVVASGVNGTILHYMSNGGVAKSGDFVMVDAGCQVHGLCSDVSRSWPVSGKFSGPQRDMYNLVLDVQLRCIDMVREGMQMQGRKLSVFAIHDFAAVELTRGLLSLGFMQGMSVEEAVTKGTYTRWFSHSIGHYLGYDVHDTHSLSKDLPFESGMCVTIEPGLYVRADDETAPEEFRGLGMRIEDDLIVRSDGAAPEVLSHEAVKSVEDIEALVGSGDCSALGGRSPPPGVAHRDSENAKPSVATA